MFNLKGKKALVTGSTQGIGFEIAKILSDHGASVFVHGGTSMEKCIAASEKIAGSKPVLCNLADKNCAETLYSQTGDVDILVLNASLQIRNGIEKVTDEEFDSQLHINLRSSISLMQRYMPYMKQQKQGRILTIGSVNQYKQNPTLAVYAASKSALFNIVENMARQLAPYGITVNNIAPGVIATPRNDEGLSDENCRKKVLSAIPVGYVGEAFDIAPAALLLCAEEGRYITGADIVIDGGMHL